jgi:serine protease Do
VKLESRPPEAARGAPQTVDPMNLDGLPKELADRIRDAIANNVGGTELDDQDGGIQKQMDLALRNMQLQMRAAGQPRIVPPPVSPGGKTESHGQSTIRIKDNEGSVEIKSQDGARQVTLRDSQDQVTWSGPWDNAQDKAAAPETALRRIEALNFDMDFNGNGMSIRPRNAQPRQLAPGH